MLVGWKLHSLHLDRRCTLSLAHTALDIMWLCRNHAGRALTWYATKAEGIYSTWALYTHLKVRAFPEHQPTSNFLHSTHIWGQEILHTLDHQLDLMNRALSQTPSAWSVLKGVQAGNPNWAHIYGNASPYYWERNRATHRWVPSKYLHVGGFNESFAVFKVFSSENVSKEKTVYNTK